MDYYMSKFKEGELVRIKKNNGWGLNQEIVRIRHICPIHNDLNHKIVFSERKSGNDASCKHGRFGVVDGREIGFNLSESDLEPCISLQELVEICG